MDLLDLVVRWVPVLRQQSLVEAVTTLLRAPSRRCTPIALSPLTSVGVQQETIYRYVYVKLAAGVAYYGFVPENIITTVEQTSGYITTTYAPIGLRSTKESTQLIEQEEQEPWDWINRGSAGAPCFRQGRGCDVARVGSLLPSAGTISHQHHHYQLPPVPPPPPPPLPHNSSRNSTSSNQALVVSN